MQRLDEEETTVRVTRSLRKRLNSVDRDSDTSPTGISKKASLNKTNTLEAISELGYDDINVEQNNNESNDTAKTPLKNNKSVSEDDNTPLVRRRTKISMSEEKETPKKLNISKASVNNLNSPMPAKRVTRRNSTTENLDISLNAHPARRVTRRTSITADDVLSTMTPPIKQARSKRLSVLHIEAPVKEEEDEILDIESSPKNNSKILNVTDKSPSKTAEINSENHGLVKSDSAYENCFVSLVDVLKKPDHKKSPKNKSENDNEIPMVSISSLDIEENSIMNDSKVSNEEIIIETQMVEKIKTPLRSTIIQKQKLFLSSTPNNAATPKENKESNSFKQVNALSDSELFIVDKKEKAIIAEPSKSWLQSVKGFASTNDGIDTIALNKNKTLEELNTSIVETPKKKKKSKQFIESDDENTDHENDDENDSRESKSEFISNEAKEVVDYSENDSMDSEEEKYVKDNEIHEEGHSIGSEDTTGDEQSDESNLSFVVNDDEDDEDILLEGSGDDLSLNENTSKKEKKFFSRICLLSSDDEINVKNIKNTSSKGNSFEKKLYLNDNVESISSDDIELTSNCRKLHNKKCIVLSDDNVDSVDCTQLNNTSSKNGAGIYLNSPKENKQNDTIKFIDDDSVISQKSPLQLYIDKANNEESNDEIAPTQINSITNDLHNVKYTSPTKVFDKNSKLDVAESENETSINKSKSFKKDSSKTLSTPKVNKSINKSDSIKKNSSKHNSSSNESEEKNEKVKNDSLRLEDVFKNNQNESITPIAATSPSVNINQSLTNKSKHNKTLDLESNSQILNISKLKSLNKSLNKSSQNISLKENNLSPLKSIDKNKSSSGLIETKEENEENSTEINEKDLTPIKSKQIDKKSKDADHIRDDNVKKSNDSDAKDDKEKILNSEEESEEDKPINKSKSFNNSHNKVNITPKLMNRRMSTKETGQEDKDSSSESEEENLNQDSMNDDESSSDEADEKNKSAKNIASSKSVSPMKKAKATVTDEDASSALSISTILQKCEKFLEEKETNKKVLRQQMKIKKTDKKQRKRKMKKQEAETNPIVEEKEIEINNKSSQLSSSPPQKLQSSMKLTNNKPTLANVEVVGSKKRKYEKQEVSPPKIVASSKLNKKHSNANVSDDVLLVVGKSKQNISGKSKLDVNKITKIEKVVKNLSEKPINRTDSYLPPNFLEALEKEEIEKKRKRKLSDKTKEDLEIRKKPKNAYFINEKDLVQKENRVQTITKKSGDKLLFNEEPVTPDVAKRNCGFKVSPITPVRKDFKVESMKKLKKRNLGNIIEPRTVLPSTSWSRSGEFKVTDINMKKEKKLYDAEYTDFIVTSLDTKKLNKKNKLQTVIDHTNNAALKFKQEKLAKHKKATCTTKQMLQSEIKGMVNKKFR